MARSLVLEENAYNEELENNAPCIFSDIPIDVTSMLALGNKTICASCGNLLDRFTCDTCGDETHAVGY